MVADLQRRGTLEQHLEAKGIEAEQMFEAMSAQMRAQKVDGETFTQRLARFQQIPVVANEIVLNESVYAL